MVLIAIFLAAASPHELAPYTAEPFSVAKDPCSRWTAEMQLGGIVRQRFTSWLEGVLVGKSAAVGTTPPAADETLVARDWLDRYCRDHPTVSLSVAASALLAERRRH